ncbi:MAG: hypothetical protein A3K65_04855 [Euryarchaeota archaeon RBG_16_68_12]|nr:MAG: hypothetical protein A3K65_04855 [Euryarchaeota archaeon RBG_16_68_12]
MAGGLAWLGHSVLVMAAFLVLGVTRGLNPDEVGLLAASVAIECALIVGAIASFLLGVGALLLASATTGLARYYRAPSDVSEAMEATARRSGRAGLSFLMFGGAAILAILLTLIAFGSSLGVLAVVSLLWAAASVVLVVAATDLSDALARVQQIVPNDAWGKPPSLRVYAYVNLVGVLFLAVPLLVLAIMPPGGTTNEACFVALGAAVAGIGAPVAAFWGFTDVIRFGLATGRVPALHGPGVQ